MTMATRKFSDVPGDWEMAQAAARMSLARSVLHARSTRDPQVELPGTFTQGVGFRGTSTSDPIKWKDYD